jgi:hypothetical protein
MDLRVLASTRGYDVRRKGDHYWLMDRRTQLPIVNVADGNSLLFSFVRAYEVLEGLAPLKA